MYETIRIKKQDLTLELAVHKSLSKTIIINYPGYRGDINGYNNKYVTLADFLQEKNLSAIVRIANFPVNSVPYHKSVKDNLQFVIEYVLDNAAKICGEPLPTINLMGFSAGAGAIAAVAHNFPSVAKILLAAPSQDAGVDDISEGLNAYRGEVYIVVGANDEVVGEKTADYFYHLATNAKTRKAIIVPNCDHQFRGEINGRILSKAPLWAFAGDKTFPSPDGGIKLYD